VRHDCMDLGTPLRGVQEVERIRTNIGHIRVKMSGTYFPDRVEDAVSDCTGAAIFGAVEIEMYLERK